MAGRKKRRDPAMRMTVSGDDFPGFIEDHGPFASGPQPSHKEQITILRDEVDRLRGLLSLDRPMDEEVWGEHAPQELRDNFAASALVAANLHPINGLARLGFPISKGENGKIDPYWYELAKRIFGSPGVKAILAEDAEKFSGNKEAVMRRMAEIAKHGDPSNSVRAAAQLSRMLEGWNDGEKGKLPQQVVNFLMHIGGGASSGRENNELPAAADNVVDADEFFALDAQEVPVVIDEPQAAIGR